MTYSPLLLLNNVNWPCLVVLGFAEQIGIIYLLLSVLLHFVVNIIEFNTCFFKHFFRFGTIVIFSLTHHSFNTTIYYEHGTCSAGCHPAIQACAVKGDPSSGCLCNGILLCMNSPDTVLGYRSVFMYYFFK